MLGSIIEQGRARYAATLVLAAGMIAASVVPPSGAMAAPLRDAEYDGKAATGEPAYISVDGRRKRASGMFNIDSADLVCASDTGGNPIWSGLLEISRAAIKRDRRFTRTATWTERQDLTYVTYLPPTIENPAPVRVDVPYTAVVTRTSTLSGRFSKNSRTVKGTYRVINEVNIASGDLPPGAAVISGSCDTGKVRFTAKRASKAAAKST